MVKPTENELENFANTNAKQKEIEMYQMDKFERLFQLYECGTKAECFRKINQYRMERGYKTWKSIGSLVRLWDLWL